MIYKLNRFRVFFLQGLPNKSKNGKRMGNLDRVLVN